MCVNLGGTCVNLGGTCVNPGTIVPVVKAVLYKENDAGS
jgi:hypothetical protein